MGNKERMNLKETNTFTKMLADIARLKKQNKLLAYTLLELNKKKRLSEISKKELNKMEE